MTTPRPRDAFVDENRSLDERLDEAFRRYDVAFHDHSDKLVEARMNLSLLLWSDEDPPTEVSQQLQFDAEVLLRETPALPETRREADAES